MIHQNSTGTLVALRGALPTASGLADRRRGTCCNLRAPTALRPHHTQADPLAAVVLVPDWLWKYKDVLVFWTSALAAGALFDTVLVRKVIARVLRVAADSLAPQSHRERPDEKGHEKEEGHEEQEEEEEETAEKPEAAMRHPAPVAETPESARRLMVASSALTALAATVSVRRAGRRAALRPERPGKAASDERSSSRKSTPQFSAGGSRRQSRQLSSQAMQKITSISRQVSNAPRGQPRPQVVAGGASSSSVGKRSPRDTPPRTPPSDTRSTLRSTPRDGDSGSTPDLDQASHAVSVDPSLHSHSAPDSADEELEVTASQELEVFRHTSSVHWAAGVESPQRPPLGKPGTDRHKRFNDAMRRKSAGGLLLGTDAENDRAGNVSSSVRRTSSMPLSWDSLSTGEFKRQQTLDSADTLDMERGGGSHYGSFSSADFGDEGSDDDDEDEEEEEEDDEDDEEYDEEYDEEDYVEEEEEEEDVGRVVEEEEGGEDEDESEDDGVREEWWRSEGEDEEGTCENPSR